MTECLPMSATALLPVVLMTWLGVMDSKEICKNYLKVGKVIVTALCDKHCQLKGPIHKQHNSI